MLHVKPNFFNAAAPVKTVRLHRAENSITCSSEGIYPEPDLTWSTEPPARIFLRSSTIVQQTEQQLYNIRSSLMVKDNDTDLTYSCTVGSQEKNQTARLVLQEDSGDCFKVIKLLMKYFQLNPKVFMQTFSVFSGSSRDRDSCWSHSSDGVNGPTAILR